MLRSERFGGKELQAGPLGAPPAVIRRPATFRYRATASGLIVLGSSVAIAVTLGPHALAGVWIVGLLASAVLLVVQPPALRELMGQSHAVFEETELDQSFWVEMVTIQESVETSADQGVLWFESGAIFFSGESGSFALRPSDVVSVGYRKGEKPTDCPIHEMEVLNPHGPNLLTLQLSVIARKTHDRNPWIDREFADQIHSFLAAPTNTEGASQLPPLAVKPELIFRPSARSVHPARIALAGACLLMGALTGSVLGATIGGIIALVVALAGRPRKPDPRLVEVARRHGIS